MYVPTVLYSKCPDAATEGWRDLPARPPSFNPWAHRRDSESHREIPANNKSSASQHGPADSADREDSGGTTCAARSARQARALSASLGRPGARAAVGTPVAYVSALHYVGRG